MSKRYFYRQVDPSEMSSKRWALAEATRQFAEEDLGLGSLDITYIKPSDCPFDRLLYIANELDGKKYTGIFYEKRICGVAYHKSEKIMVRADLSETEMCKTILHEARHIFQKYNPSNVDKEFDAEQYENEAVKRVYSRYKKKLSRGGNGMYNTNKLEKLDVEMNAIIAKMGSLFERALEESNELLSAKSRREELTVAQIRHFGYETKISPHYVPNRIRFVPLD